MQKAQTPAQRKAAERERNRDAGFKLAQVWVHPDDFARFRKYVNALNKRRGLA